MRVNFQKEKGVEMVSIYLTKYINTSVSGDITVFGEKENFLKMKKCFLKAISRKD